MLSENMEHASLIGRPSVTKSERHGYVIVHTKRGDERGCELVRLFHFYLMVAGISIKEREGFTSHSGIDILINVW